MDNTLFEISLSCVLKNLKRCLNWNEIAALPPRIKGRIFNYLSLKCEVNDENLSFLVDKYTTIADLSSCDISNEGLKKLAVCTCLQRLRLGIRLCLKRNDIRSGLHMIFTNCHRLTYVDLRGYVSVDDECITLLAQNSPNLQVLDISDCRIITDSALEALANHSWRIKCIGVNNTQISDAGALHIANSKCSETLQEFNAGFTRKLTGKSVQILLKKCPKLSILSYHFLGRDGMDDELWKLGLYNHRIIYGGGCDLPFPVKSLLL